MDSPSCDIYRLSSLLSILGELSPRTVIFLIVLSWGGGFSQLSFINVLFPFNIFIITHFRVVLSFEPPLDHNRYLCHVHISVSVWNIPMIRMCEIDIGNLKKRKLAKLVQVRNFITFELKVIRHKERETIFVCWLLLHRQLSTQPTRGARSAQIHLVSAGPESQPSSSEAGTQLTAFSQIPKLLSPRFRCMTSLTSPGPNSYLGFLFWHLWMTHLLRTRVNTCVNVAPN